MLTHPVIIIFGKCQPNTDTRTSSSHEQTATSCMVNVTSRMLYKGSNVIKGFIITLLLIQFKNNRKILYNKPILRARPPNLTVLIGNILNADVKADLNH